MNEIYQGDKHQLCRKFSLTSSKVRRPILGDNYKFTILVSGKSFRNLKREDRSSIKKSIKEIVNNIPKNKVESLFEKKLAVRFELFLSSSYIKRVDIDNVVKTILDCMNKVIFKDDRQVYALDVIKHEAHKGAVGCTISEFKGVTISPVRDIPF
ncbi:MAG: RusA family crossover junction endodeoxyribonuclease [archaeon]